MSGTLTPTGLRWNDPGDDTWDTDENANITDLNDTLLKPEGLADVDNTGFGTGFQDLVVRRNAGNNGFDVVSAPYVAEFVTTTTSTTTTTT